jgi:hypothetical protein
MQEPVRELIDLNCGGSFDMTGPGVVAQEQKNMMPPA